MKYDDIKWHINDDFPSNLSQDAALTHMGMFLGWGIEMGLESDLLKSNFQAELNKFKKRELKGSQIVKLCCDSKITSDDLNDRGNQFAEKYYSQKYFDDYANLSDDNNESIFQEPDTWDKFNQIKNIITKRYNKMIK